MSAVAVAVSATLHEDRKARNRDKHDRTLLRHQEKKKRKLVDRGISEADAEEILREKRRKKWDAKHQKKEEKAAKPAAAVTTPAVTEIPAIPEQKLFSLRPNAATIELFANRGILNVFDSSFARLRQSAAQVAQGVREKVRSGQVEVEEKELRPEDLLITPKQKHDREVAQARSKKREQSGEKPKVREAKPKKTKEEIAESKKTQKVQRRQSRLDAVVEQQERMANELRKRLEANKDRKTEIENRLGFKVVQSERPRDSAVFPEPGLPTGWDKKTEFVAEFDEKMPEKIKVKIENVKTEEGSKNKKSKNRALGELNSLLTEYKPELIGSFAWTERGDAIDTSSPSAFVDSINSRLDIPGNPRFYQTPRLPIKFDCEPKWRKVEKAPIAALLIALNKSQRKIFSKPTENDEVAFVAFRHSLRHIILGISEWRVDVQRRGNFIFLRRYANYDSENIGDAGHRFEEECTNQTTGEANFRSVIRAKLGKHTILTSVEVDAVDRAEEGKEISIENLIELKTLKKGNLTTIKSQAMWAQAFLGGIQTIRMGEKDTAADYGQIMIEKIVERKTSSLIPTHSQAALVSQLDRILQFLIENVEEGNVYKLCRKQGEDGQKSIKLEKIPNGIETAPIVTDKLIKKIEKKSKTEESEN